MDHSFMLLIVNDVEKISSLHRVMALLLLFLRAIDNR